MSFFLYLVVRMDSNYMSGAQNHCVTNWACMAGAIYASYNQMI